MMGDEEMGIFYAEILSYSKGRLANRSWSHKGRLSECNCSGDNDEPTGLANGKHVLAN